MLLAELVKLIIPIVAIVIGWVIVHKLSIARDRDKARREMIGKVVDVLADEASKLMTTSILYHLAARDTAKETELKITLQDFSTRASLLARVSDDAAELACIRSSIVGLRKAITAQHFEDEHVTPLEQRDLQIQLIAESVLKIKENLTKLKYCQFSV